ncbi:trigger factor [soil metagenome]
MHTQIKKPTTTQAVLTVTAEQADIRYIKNHVLQDFSKQAKIAGFRPGKAPLEIVEKNVDQSTLQTQFLEHAVEALYPQAAQEVHIRPVSQPELAIKKFVPFTVLEFEVTVTVLGDVTLPDYTKMTKKRITATVSAKDVEEVIKNLQERGAEKKEVDRVAKNSDQVLIDFSGKNQKGEDIKGADGKDYPLALGSNTFIPGFEEKLVGARPGETKEFTLTFPKDYGMKALAGSKVTFSVTVKKVLEVVKPKVDDAFAASVGPVKTVVELKADIKKELQIEKQRKADMEFESELVQDITKKSNVEIPPVLIDEQVERMMGETKKNLTYRGQTLKEFLEQQGMSEEEYKKKEVMPQAEDRVKASIVLSEIAEKERLTITPEELEIRLQVLKGQYQDEQMRSELDKPENRREILSRMLSEKTLATLANYVTKA